LTGRERLQGDPFWIVRAARSGNAQRSSFCHRSPVASRWPGMMWLFTQAKVRRD
jgi:hypothetical protein